MNIASGGKHVEVLNGALIDILGTSLNGMSSPRYSNSQSASREDDRRLIDKYQYTHCFNEIVVLLTSWYLRQ
jgi:hypothetical protein